MPLPEKYRVVVTLPNEVWEKRLENAIQKTNQIVLSKGLTGSLKHRLFRLGSGVQGEVYPVELIKVASSQALQAEKERKIELELNLSGLSEDDLVKIASFSNRFIPK